MTTAQSSTFYVDLQTTTSSVAPEAEEPPLQPPPIFVTQPMPMTLYTNPTSSPLISLPAAQTWEKTESGKEPPPMGWWPQSKSVPDCQPSGTNTPVGDGVATASNAQPTQAPESGASTFLKGIVLSGVRTVSKKVGQFIAESVVEMFESSKEEKTDYSYSQQYEYEANDS